MPAESFLQNFMTHSIGTTLKISNRKIRANLSPTTSHIASVKIPPPRSASSSASPVFIFSEGSTYAGPPIISGTGARAFATLSVICCASGICSRRASSFGVRQSTSSAVLMPTSRVSQWRRFRAQKGKAPRSRASRSSSSNASISNLGLEHRRSIARDRNQSSKH